MKDQSKKVYGLLGACVVGALIGTAAMAIEVDPATIKRGDVGPVTPYGELPEEAAAKRVMFDWLYMLEVERKPKEAFEKYVSKNYCNHSHISTKGKKPCFSYEETLASWIERHPEPLKPGQKIEIPTMASVNGEMVTMYGAGVDVFRVVDGKITDHWDGSPPAEVTIKAHDPAGVARAVARIEEAVAERNKAKVVKK
ncbi:MAG: hypothetical protein QM808_05085 [Steroidobacteraceae bacterium]